MQDGRADVCLPSANTVLHNASTLFEQQCHDCTVVYSHSHLSSYSSGIFISLLFYPPLLYMDLSEINEDNGYYIWWPITAKAQLLK